VCGEYCGEGKRSATLKVGGEKGFRIKNKRRHEGSEEKALLKEQGSHVFSNN
jgi:hypothetical protein